MTRLHQPDINGTHVAVDTPFTKEVAALFREWIKQGNIFAPNTSYTIKKISQNIRGIANGHYITELGVAVYESDAKSLAQYHGFSRYQRDIAANYFSRFAEQSVHAAGFFPRCEATSTHGIYVFINSSIDDQTLNYFLQRYHKVEKLTRDPREFTQWIIQLKKEIGLIEWKPVSKKIERIPLELKEFEYTYKYSYDSGGTCFITPKGVTKASTFQEVLEMRYKAIPKEFISIAGDSISTDGSLFAIPNITHIAVKDKNLLQDISGENIFVEIPEKANKIIKDFMQFG